jgi:hypothetical protein
MGDLLENGLERYGAIERTADISTFPRNVYPPKLP